MPDNCHRVSHELQDQKPRIDALPSDHYGPSYAHVVRTNQPRSSVARKAIKADVRAAVLVLRSDLPNRDFDVHVALICIVRDLHHRNIVGNIGHFEDDQAYYLVTEYLGDPSVDELNWDADDDDVGYFFCCVPADPVTGRELPMARIVSRGGAADMFSYIYGGSSPAPSHTVLPLLRDVAAAVAHLQGLGITHGDMKEENVLLTPGPDLIAKLCDFGHARQSELLPNLRHACDTPPSELVRVSGFKADVWALGQLLYRMIMRSNPPDIVGGRIDIGEFETLPCSFRDDVEVGWRNLVERMLTIDPEKRMSAADILHHPWLIPKTANSKRQLGVFRGF
ncbi:kinase-like domain-containing protein [Blyttiomyces helicus]|uniref:Kinase-like domain-containing protein n=1 Tax=Blyttiomyces helicus TaxID=388810 RepID=A0A4P9W4L6_9FUNG|nr:kinase-like domain-containing protein [Blyttiomyces helicus]|eukprot:RKO87299.1 kinase-like domain-containing protein [Blyttiomyces helicus]